MDFNKVSQIAFVCMLSFAIGCSESDEPTTGVNIRLSNTSDFDYKDVYVNTSGGEFNFGNIKPNKRTAYHRFPFAYSYAYIELKIDGVTYKLQPIDYFGEEQLEDGIYTYRIDAKKDGDVYDRLSLQLVKD
jgi:hypothetical protein